MITTSFTFKNTKRRKLVNVANLTVLACIALNGCTQDKSIPKFQQTELNPGGAFTTQRLSTRSYVEPGNNLSASQKLNFWTGFSLFRDPWVIAPSSTKDRDGLGPLFNTRSCISCHTSGGRGLPPKSEISKPSALVIRLGGTEIKGPVIDPNYGGQIQPRAVDKTLSGEAQLKVQYESINGQYADGEAYQLQRPQYQLVQLASGPLANNIGLSPRLAPIVYGAGLLDAIDESDLIYQEDINDKNNDGISARYNRVPNVVTHTKQVGRFGHKAKHPNLQQQVAAAFRDDIGITSTLFPEESCIPEHIHTPTQAQIACNEYAKKGGHLKEEIPNNLLNLVVHFNQGLAVPPARHLQSKQAQEGRTLFYQIGCESCHTPSHTTRSDYPSPALANQVIWPYTDLALHDMGEGLADGVIEFQANGNEWRTPPLWGLGAQSSWRKERHFLHDGRAKSFSEAILWHGGEAQKSQQQFIQLSQSERKALVAFLEAI